MIGLMTGFAQPLSKGRWELGVDDESRGVASGGRCGEDGMVDRCRRVDQAGANVLALEVREVPENLVGGGAAGEHFEDVGHADAQAADARPAAALTRVDGDALRVAH